MISVLCDPLFTYLSRSLLLGIYNFLCQLDPIIDLQQSRCLHFVIFGAVFVIVIEASRIMIFMDHLLRHLVSTLIESTLLVRVSGLLSSKATILDF